MLSLSRNCPPVHPLRMLCSVAALCLSFITLAPAVAHASSNTVLEWDSELPYKICPEDAGGTITVCASLYQKCGHSDHEPLMGRELLFFLNSGDCGVDVGQNADDSVLTDESGHACATLTIPTAPGKYSIRVKFRGEAKPDPCPEEGNGVCSDDSKSGGKKCVALSDANLCEKFSVDPDVCCEPVALNGPPDTTVTLCSLPERICIGPWNISCNEDDGHEEDGGKSGEDGHSDHHCDRRDHDHDGDGHCDEPDEHHEDDCEVETSFGDFLDGRVCFEADTAGIYTIIICAGDEDNDYDHDHDDHDGGKSGDDGDDDHDCDRPDHDHDHDGDCDEHHKHCDGFACDTVVVHVELAGQLICAADTAVDCNAPTDPGSTGYTIRDGCDGRVEYYDRITPEACLSEYTIHRIWYVDDGAGNRDSCIQMIAVRDTIPPACEVPNDTLIELCAPGEICLPVSAIDDCNDAVVCRVTDSPGEIIDGLWCYQAEASEQFTVNVVCTDACGNVCRASFAVTIHVNRPPVCDVQYPSPPLCAPPVLFVPFSSSDPDGDPTACTLYGPGALVAGGWQYAPAPGELVVARIVCTDICGDSCVIPIEIQVPQTEPPICNLPGDQTIFRCGPGADSLPVSAGGAECRLINSPGTLRNGWWVYESTGNETIDVHVECATACDTCSGSFRVTFARGNPPECHLPNDTTIFRCHPGADSLPYATSGDAACELVQSPGILRNGWWVYDVQSDETVAVTIRCTNECGSCEKTFNVTYDVNEPPVCVIPNDTLIFLGTGPHEVRLPVSATDADGNFASCAIVDGPGVILNGDWVYTPQGPGQVCVTVSCRDGCDAICEATFCVDFTLNQPPECSLLLDPSPPLCAPTLLVVPFTSVDPEGGPISCTVEGPGELFDHTWQYLPIPGEQVSARIVCRDTLGDSCVLSIEVAIPSPQPPLCVLPNDTAIFLCDAGPDSLPVTATGGGVCRLVNSPGILRNGWWVYDAQQDEILDVTVECVTLCDTCNGSFRVVYDVNEPPVCLVPHDTTIFQAVPAEIRLPVTGADQDENFTSCELVSGPGVLANGLWIYTPSGAETVCATVVCRDACGDSCVSTFCVTINLNEPPVCSLLSSTETGPCTPSVVLLDFSSVDPEGGPVTCALNGPGQLLDHTWRYVPTPGETVNTTIVCRDEYGDSCVIPISMTFPDPVSPQCALPNDTTITICGPTQVAIPVAAAQSENCRIIAGPGELVYGAWVYTPTGGGSVDVTLQCAGICDTCEGTFRVTFVDNEPPRISFAGLNKEVLQCEPAEVCMPYDVFDPDGLEGLSVTLLSGPGTLDAFNNQVCFTPGYPGFYRFVVQVTDPCGDTDLDSITMQVTLSGPPSCNLPPDHRIILCEPSEICFPISSTDQSALGVVCEVVDGVGEVRGNNWCYFVDSAQTVMVTLRCTDACGNTCQILRTYTVEIDSMDCAGLALRAGDLDRSGYINVVDVTRLARLLYSGNSGNRPTAAAAQRGPSEADVNCDGAVNGSDLTYLSDFVFRNGVPPCLLRGIVPAPAGARKESAHAKSGSRSRSGGKRR